MKVLFDQNLSFKLCTQLADVFPDSSRARLLGLHQADDRTLWQHAKVTGLTLVTHDTDSRSWRLSTASRPRSSCCGVATNPPQLSRSYSVITPKPSLHSSAMTVQAVCKSSRQWGSGAGRDGTNARGLNSAAGPFVGPARQLSCFCPPAAAATRSRHRAL